MGAAPPTRFTANGGLRPERVGTREDVGHRPRPSTRSQGRVMKIPAMAGALCVLAATLAPSAAQAATDLTLAPSADTRVLQARPTESFGTSTTLSTSGKSGALQQSYVRFDV